MSVLIDFQGFEKPTGLFAIKELAIQPLNPTVLVNVMVFKSPCSKNQLSEDYQKSIKQSEETFHGIPWDSGDGKFEEPSDILVGKLCEKVEYIFVKGIERKNWLISMLNDKHVTIINIDDLGCPEHHILQLQPVIKHSLGHPLCQNYMCAYENVQRYKNWFIRDFSLRSNIRKSIILFCAVDNLSNLTAKDIAKLPVMAIIKFAASEIDGVWDKLSEKQKKNQIVAGWRRCTNHPLEEFGDITGIYFFSYVKDCIKCQNNNNKKTLQI